MTTSTSTRRAMRLIRPDDWNRVARKIAAKKNRAYQSRESGGWRHPWHTRARWDAGAAQWAVQVQPGYVNAAETLAPAMAARLAPVRTLARLGLPPGSRERVVPWLSEGPWIRIGAGLWREIGTGTVGDEPVPDFFVALGVEGSTRVVVDTEQQTVALVPPVPVPRDRRRLLRAVDLVLTVPKPTVQIGFAETAQRGTELDWTVSAASGDPHIAPRRIHVPQAPPPTLQEQIVTGRTEDPHIERLVATVYLASPAGAPESAEIGPAWQPYAKHALFWNLAYGARVTFDFVPAQPLVSSLPLAGGAGQPAMQAILDDLNSRDAQLARALGRGSTRTSFGSV